MLKVEVSGKLISFPPICACCRKPADTELGASASRSSGKRVVRVTTFAWSFPYCSACVQHTVVLKQGDEAFSLVVIVAGILAVLVCFGSVLAGIATGILGLIIAAFLRSRKEKEARRLCSPECACSKRAVDFLGWQGTVQSFYFWNAKYAAQFMNSNASKLVNVRPDARAALESFRAERDHETRAELAARAAQATAAYEAVRADMQESSLLGLLARVEAAKGPAARRAAVDAGLRALTQPSLKERFALEASRIAVEAALEKADTLKGTAAKLRTLQAALDEVRNDSIDDAQQAQQIQWLEAAIAELGEGKG